MRILVLAKRQYTGRDLLDDRYGRVFEMPAVLARRGHMVRGIALSYRRRGDAKLTWPDLPGLAWESVDAGPMGTGLFRYRASLLRAAREFEPDAIWATSDAYHAIAGAWLSRRFRVPLVLDFYDNYESFGASRVPGVMAGLRAAARHASAVTVVSTTLAERLARSYGLAMPPVVIGNAVDTSTFHARGREQSRNRFGLPQHARVVGIAGALTASRGIGDVFEAFLRLSRADPNLWFAFAGPRDGTVARYKHPRIRDLGELLPVEVPSLLSALDVAVVSNIDSSFGRYCFPQKLFEAVACGVAVVATRIGEVERLLSDFPGALYPQGDPAALAGAISDALARPRRISLPVPTWIERGECLAVLLERL